MPSEYLQFFRLLPLLLTFLVYPLVAGLVLRAVQGAWRWRVLAVANLGLLPVLCVLAASSGVRRAQLREFLAAAAVPLAAYVASVLVSRYLLGRFGRGGSGLVWAPFAFPLLVLLVLRQMPSAWAAYYPGHHAAEIFLGISYIAFRLSHLSLEYRNGVVELPTWAQYLAFAFFPPTLTVGPISPFSMFLKSVNQPERGSMPVGRCWARIAQGMAKYLFLANLANQLAYQGLLFDGHPHHWIDVPVAAFSYLLYLYLNFSGWCDVAIGTSGLMGIRIAENFAQPFQSRNVQEWWNRWHITLGTYLRDVVFSPLSKALVMRFGPKSAPHAIAASIMTVFLTMGVWHGLTWNYILYGFSQGVAVVSVHYYTQWLKKRLGRDGFQRYEANPYIRWVGVVLTVSYAAATLMLFANSMDGLRRIWSVIHM